MSNNKITILHQLMECLALSGDTANAGKVAKAIALELNNMTKDQLIQEMANEMALPQTVKHTTKAEIALQVILKYYDLTPKGQE